MIETLVGVIIALVGTAHSAWNDWKTGYVNDNVSHAMIISGAILVLLAQPLSQAAWTFATAGIVFAAGFVAYLFGQIGGGDVKLFTGLALLIPQYPQELVGALPVQPVIAPYPFIVSVFVLFGIFFTLLIPTVYLKRLIDRKKQIKDFRMKSIKGAAYGLAFLPLFVYWFFISKAVAVLFLPAAVALVLIPFKDDVVRLFFAQQKKVADLNEEDVLALELIKDSTKKTLHLWRKTFTNRELETIKRLAKKRGVRTLLVCENLPRAVPHIFAALCVSLVFGDFLLWLVLNAF